MVQTGFVIVFNDKILTNNTIPKLTSDIHINQNFYRNSLTPLFQEEKDVLFIFCLNNIFVISSLYHEMSGELEHVILYELSNKPANPFPVTSSYFTKFNDLPTPYEPTLFIGNNRLDDVNLLSKVSKYKLFSRNKINSQGEINTYNLPTHYDEEKHGGYEAEVTFYKDKYKGQVFPVFLGKEGENFENLAGYGNIINQQNPVLVEKGYIAKENFVYRGKKGKTPSPVPVKEILGLTKEEFFEMKVKDSSENIYQYLLNYIEQKLKDTQDDRVLVFKLPYERTSEYLDENDSGVDGVFVEQSEVLIYVQFRFFETTEVSFVDKVSKQGRKITVDVDDSDENVEYPEYPPTEPGLKEFYIGEKDENENGIPFEKKDFTVNDFRNMANNWLEENKNTIEVANNEEIVLKLQMFERKVESNTEFLDFPHYTEWHYTSIVDGWDIEFEYPGVHYGDELEVITLDTIRKSKFEEPAHSTYMLNEISKGIKAKFDELTANKGYAIVRFTWQSYYIDYGGTVYEEQQKIVFRFYYNKGDCREWENRNSFVMTTKATKGGKKIVDDLYELWFDKEKNAFVFECKDYFYDFNNEPAIDVKITFERNPDYKKIAESRFGTTFGSENRLFLAGNKEYPNIDRFNVSNDLLGDNIKNQSYELTYFPSGNYRVLGGRGAINGYVVSTDTQLYITKEDYPNDQKLFIRNRTMDDNGIVGYNEFKTNIERTPLNSRTLVRFYNDILVLDKNGLFGLEIEGNVLTNERMVKMRSGFINEDLKDNISKVGKDKVFIYEDNHYMYMFVGKKVYVADSRYVDQNPNAEPGNFNYEIVVWDIPVEFKTVKRINGDLELLDITGKHIYTMRDDNTDDIVDRKRSYLSKSGDINETSLFFASNNGFVDFEDKKEVAFVFDNDRVFKLLATNDDADFEINNRTIKFVIKNEFAFRGVVDGDTLYLKWTGSTSFLPITVNNFEASGRESFTFEYFGTIEEPFFGNSGYEEKLYIDVSKQRLYPFVYYKDGDKTKVILSPFYQVPEVVESVGEALDLSSGYHNQYIFQYKEGMMKDVLIIEEEKIKLRWISAILDFGNNIFEKTMFKANIYATKQEKENRIKIGYRTMRRFNRFYDEDMMANVRVKNIEASNPFDFGEVLFNLFSINTINEFASSIPMKENNFMYVQFIVVGEGDIELNAIEILYKLNRMLKTIG